MRLRFFIASVLMAAAVMTGCTTEEDFGAPDIVLSQNELSFTQESGTQSITLTATREWKVTSDADWVAVTPEGGKPSLSAQAITVSVQSNAKGNRQAKLLFTIGTVTKELLVKQAGPDGDTGGVESLTVKEFIAKADTKNYYRLTGTVSGFNSQYCSFDLTDETGEIYVYSVTEESKEEWSGKIKNGGTIVIQGKYEYYAAKQQHEVVNAIIESFTPGQEEDPSKVQKITCAEFIQKADEKTTYRLVGEVTSSVNTTYCSFDMNDGTATVVVWTVNNAAEWKNVVKQGGTVTVRGKYMFYKNASTGQEKHEMVDAYIEAFEPAAVVPTSTEGVVVAVSARAFLVKTASGHDYVYAGKDPGVKVGDTVKVTGEVSEYAGVKQIANPVTTVVSSGATVTHPAVTALDAAAFDKYDTVFGYVKINGKLTNSGDYYNIKVTGAGRTGSLSYPVSVDAALVNKYVDVTGYFVGISGSSYFNILVTDMTLAAEQPAEPENPSLPAIPENATVITLDASAKLCEGFPDTSAGATSKNTYKIGGYDWTFCPSEGQKYSWYKDGYVLWGKTGAYILMPAIEGKKLTQVRILTGKNISVKVTVGVYDAEGKAAVKGGEDKLLDAKDAEFGWVLTESAANTAYQLRVVNEYNAQFQKLTCVYE